MVNKQLELLVVLQDLEIMLQEIDEVEELGFKAPNRESLEKAKEEIIQKISKPYLNRYNIIRKKYKRAIVMVKNDTCLGCNMRQPTSSRAIGIEDSHVLTCEGCGRILYWLE